MAFLSTACKKEEIINELNKVPKVDAGPFQNITVKGDSITLSGSATDPDGTIVAYLWSQVSGPVVSNIANPGSASTIISKMINGTYVFQLAATDNEGATGVDTVSIKIDQSRELTLQPHHNDGEFQLVYRNNGDQSNTNIDFTLQAWTIGGAPLTLRQLLKFDLSSIPTNATITSAKLYLVSFPNSPFNGNTVDANYGVNNSFTIQRVTSDWTIGSSGAGFDNLPATTTTDQIVVPHTALSVLDLNIDVKTLISAMVAGNNYGMYFKLNSESIYTSRLFYGSRTTNGSGNAPKLVVTYR
jgi:hypothetical protein